jgi:hypothetical protein
MKIASKILGATSIVLGLASAAPAGAATLYQSIPDLTVAPALNAWCSQCGGDLQDIGQAFSLSSTATAMSLEFAVDNQYVWPTSVTVDIYQDFGGTVGTNIYNNTFSSFASDVATPYGTDVVGANLAGGVPLAAGDYLVFLYNTNSLGIPGYSGGAGNQVYIEDATYPSLTGDSYNHLGWDSAVSISDTAIGSVPEASTCAMMLAGFAGLGFAGYSKAKRAALSAA